MRLNNRGWGTKEMIIMMSILFISLGITAYYIYKLYNSFVMQNLEETPLSKVEDKLEEAAKNYYYDNYLDEDVIITYTDLLDTHYIESLETDLGTKCNGYVVKKIVFNAFVKCGKTETNGYNGDLE